MLPQNKVGPGGVTGHRATYTRPTYTNELRAIDDPDMVARSQRAHDRPAWDQP